MSKPNDKGETIPGTLAVAGSLAAAEERFLDLLMECATGITRDEARMAMHQMLRHKVARREGFAIKVIHGVYLEPDVIGNAVKAWKENQ